MSNIVSYGSYDIDAAKDIQKKVEAISGGNFLKLGVGDTVVRILPPTAGRNSPFRVTAVHYIDAVPGLQKMVVFTCPRVELKEPCIACEKAQQLQNSKSPIDRERAWKIGAQLKIYANVVDRDNPDAGVKILSFGKTIHEQLKKIRKNPRLGGDFTDPTKGGFDIVINREGTGQRDTKYVVSAARENSPLSTDVEEINGWIGGQHDLEKLIRVEAPDELLAAWSDLGMAHRGGGRQMAAGRQPAGRIEAGTKEVIEVQEAPKTKAKAAGKVGAGVMSGKKEREITGYDDDFNPIYADDDNIPY